MGCTGRKRASERGGTEGGGGEEESGGGGTWVVGYGLGDELGGLRLSLNHTQPPGTHAWARAHTHLPLSIPSYVSGSFYGVVAE
jgi:hypothetical protein